MASLTATGRHGELGAATEAAGGDGTAPRGTISRMLIFESGAVFVASHAGDNYLAGGPRRMLHAGACERYAQAARDEVCAATHAPHAKERNFVQKRPPYQSNVKGRSRASTEYPPPFFCPDVFGLLGIPFRTARHDHDPTADGNVHPRCADRLHWPKYTVYDDYCTVNTSDESVVVSSTDGLANLSLSPHEQIVRVAYPLMVPAESKSRVDEGRENGTADKSATVVFVVAIDQIFPAQQCPAMFKHPYCLAKKLSALDLSGENVNEGAEAEANDGCLHVVDALLPKCNVNSKDRAMNMYDWHDVTKSVSPLECPGGRNAPNLRKISPTVRSNDRAGFGGMERGKHDMALWPCRRRVCERR